jgi:hypothetical protein
MFISHSTGRIIKFFQTCFYWFHLRSENKIQITTAAGSNARTVFARSNAGIVGSNPIRGMDVCVRLFCM